MWPSWLLSVYFFSFTITHQQLQMPTPIAIMVGFRKLFYWKNICSLAILTAFEHCSSSCDAVERSTTWHATLLKIDCACILGNLPLAVRFQYIREISIQCRVLLPYFINTQRAYVMRGQVTGSSGTIHRGRLTSAIFLRRNIVSSFIIMCTPDWPRQLRYDTDQLR